MTLGREIVNNEGQSLKLAGVNWPAHLEAMVPEGLQYQSVANIVSQIKTLGMNVVRLTWATEMVDQIVDSGHDVQLLSSLVSALGTENGTLIFRNIIAHNPFLANATRLEVRLTLLLLCTSIRAI